MGGRYLSTLYLTTPGARAHRDRETVLVDRRLENGEKEKLGQFPIHMLESIICMGPVSVSPKLMDLCAQRGVTIAYFDPYGRFLARVEGPVSGNILLRKEQYRVSDDSARSLQFAKAFIGAKIRNARSVLQRHLRNYPDCEEHESLDFAVRRLAVLLEKAGSAENVDSLRGLEGQAADEYFARFNFLIKSKEPSFVFQGRSRRPPLDRINAMLSFVYTLLTHDIRSALEGVGLDPQCGFMHQDRPGRPALALDFLEEFRACVADRLVLSLVNLGQIDAEDFDVQPGGAVLLREKNRNVILTEWQKRKQAEVIHPFLDESMPLGVLFHLQALLLARTLRGDMEYYPAFIAK